ncbi:MAG TPA: DUF2191 domain-containing protein [Thermoanaerobaculia bacterium]|nr:DUF2191 domain-containing protein [Thermoanaerobaculia bacterium]
MGRTTLTLDDSIERQLKEIAHRSGKPFRTVVNETLRAGLTAGTATAKPKRFRLRPASLGNVLSGVSIDKALDLSDAIEDQELVRKLKLRK